MEIAPIWQQNVVEVGAYALSLAELLGFVTGVLCVWLTARRNILNFPFGIANCAFLLLLFVETRLFADAILQLVFIALSGFGWWQWAQGKRSDVVAIERAAPRELMLLGVAALALTAGLCWWLGQVRGSLPFWDALITALSLCAQWLLNRRKLESWVVWIAVDLISIPVYLSRSLLLVALLYVIFLGLAINGWFAWRRVAGAT
jgi:nicotinamide mononucleotide transporter